MGSQLMDDDFDAARFRERLRALMVAGDYAAVVAMARIAYNALGEVELASMLDTFDDRQRFGLSVESWMSVAWAVSIQDSMFNLAVAVWDLPGQEQAAIGLLRQALERGSLDAPPALAEYLLWVGERAEAVDLLKKLVADRPPGWERAAGLLGREYIEVDGRHDQETVDLLRIGLTVSDDFAMPLVAAESERGKFQNARRVLEEQSEKGNPLAPIKLGLLLERSFGDNAGAEAAYLRGIDLGDAYSAYNLGTLLRDQGRTEEARHWLEYAAARGDSWAVERLEEEQL
jgi:tetratricopeptide (TPR) repeat protein